MIEMQDHSTSCGGGSLAGNVASQSTLHFDQQCVLMSGRQGYHSKTSPIEIKIGQGHCGNWISCENMRMWVS